MIDAFTDYPFSELDGVELLPQKIHKCKLIAYDQNKYVDILVFFVDKDYDERVLISNIKSGYVYKNEAEYNDGVPFSYDELCELPWKY